MPRLLSIISFAIFLLPGFVQSADSLTDSEIRIKNERLELSFNSKTGALTSFKDSTRKYDFLDRDQVSTASLWLIETHTTGPAVLSYSNAKTFSWESPSPEEVILSWAGVGDANASVSTVTVNVSLKDTNVGARWNIQLDGIQNSKISCVRFPRVSNIKDLTNERLAVPLWMGDLYHTPRSHLAGGNRPVKKLEWYYPGHLSLQMLALYGNKNGLYFSADDTEAFYKEMGMVLNPDGNLAYELTHYPPFDSSLTTYTPSYNAHIDAFQGDWITAATRYREWGAAQHWSRDSRLKNAKIPSWLTDTALWLWNRDTADNVFPPALDLKNHLGLPVSVLWHWWHKDSYDDSFPEYFPPRDGFTTVASVLKNAEKEDVHTIVYMNAIKWGPETESYKNENAEAVAVKNRDGKAKSHVYNIFTKKGLTYICLSADYWREKYAELSRTAINELGTNGVYMDQACLSTLCYDSTHKHAPGGGNYWVKNFAAMSELIRKKTESTKPYMLAGEGGGEAWLPYLDAFLTLQVSKERYAGISTIETIPLFQAVYHEHALTFGNYSSLLSPPYDSRWPKEFEPKEQSQLLDAKFSSQFLMEQARSFVWGMQPAISNYRPFLRDERKTEIDFVTRLARLRHSAPEYFIHGRFMRPPALETPVKTIDISKLSIYAGQNEKVTAFKKDYPTIYCGAWRAETGKIGIPVASIQKDNYPINCLINAKDYSLPDSGTITYIDETGERSRTQYSDGKIALDYQLPPYGVVLIEITSKIKDTRDK